MTAPGAPTIRASSQVAFHVADREAAVRHLRAARCTLVPVGPQGLDAFYLRDPSGVVFGVMQRDAMARSGGGVACGSPIGSVPADRAGRDDPEPATEHVEHLPRRRCRNRP